MQFCPKCKREELFKLYPFSKEKIGALRIYIYIYVYVYVCVYKYIYIYIYILQEYTARKVVRIAQSEIHQATKAGPNQGFKSWRGELVLDF